MEERRKNEKEKRRKHVAEKKMRQGELYVNNKDTDEQSTLNCRGSKALFAKLSGVYIYIYI